MTDMNARLIVTADARQVVTATQAAQTSMQGLVNRTTQVDRASRSAAESARAFGVATDGAGDQVQRLRAQIDPLFAAQQRLESQTDLVALAFRRGEIPLELHDQLLERLQAEYRRTEAAQELLTRATGRFTTVTAGGAGGMQNFAFQLQDIFTQVGAGTPIMVSLGQQLPQLLSGFGTLGAMLGLVASAAIPLATVMFGLGYQSRRAADEVRTAAEIMEEALSRVHSAQQLFQDNALSNIDELVARYGRLNESLLTYLRALNERELRETRIAARQGVNATFDEFDTTGFGQAIAQREALIASLRTQIEQAFVDQAISGVLDEGRLEWLRGRLEEALDFSDVAISLDIDPATFERIRDLETEIRRAMATDNFVLARDLAIELREVLDATGADSLAVVLDAAIDVEGILRQLVQTIEEGDEGIAEIEARLAEAAEKGGDLDAALGEAVRNGNLLVTAIGAAAAADLTGLNTQVAFLMQRLGLAADEAIRLNNALPGSGGMVQAPGLSFGLGGVDTQAFGDFGNVTLGFGQLPDNRRTVQTLPQADDPPGRGGSGGGGGQSDHDRTVADIERRIRRLARSYEADIEAANAWRTEALANLDATAAGYEEFAAQVEVIFGEMLAEAYEADLDRREDWRAGIRRGLDQLLEDQMTWADAWENVVTGTIERGEDAWVEWVTTGRLSLQEIVDFALEQFARLAYQRAIQPALGGIFDFFGGMFGPASGPSLVKSHSGSLAGVTSTRATVGGLGRNEELAVIERGQGIFTPRQMENADALLRALASRPASAEGAVLVQPKIEVNNYTSSRVETSERADGTTEINIMDQVEREMAGRMQVPGSPLNRALRTQGVRPVYGNGRA
jgi:lambda family phage tail tape measure protein